MGLKNKESIFTDLAGLIAEGWAEELLVKQRLMMPKDRYIKEKTQSLVHDLEKEHEKNLLYMERARELLFLALENLSGEEKERYTKELLIATEKLSQNIEMEQITEDTPWQKILGLSDATLIWIYKLGFHFFEQKNNEDALSLFLLLSMLNPLASDYWIALGFAQKELSLESLALTSFSLAASLDPENPTPNYQSAEIYIQLGLLDQAVLEVQTLAKIIERQKLDFLKPDLENLLNRIQNSKLS